MNNLPHQELRRKKNLHFKKYKNAATSELVIPDLPYILPYIVEAGAAIILRVIHTSMKWPDEF